MMIRRLLGAVGLVLLVWLVDVAVESRINATRVRIGRQSERITKLGERRDGLRHETRRLGAPARMLPPSTATLGVDDRIR